LSSRNDGRQAELRGTAHQRLLDAAAAEVADHGYAGTSLQAIATRAGLSRGAVYWNFKSKPELFLALLDERIDEPVRELLRFTETAPADQPTAAAISQGLARLIADQAPLIMLLFEHWAAAVRDPALRDGFNQRQARLTAGLAHALEARHATTGVPLAYPADRLASAVLALAHGIAMHKLVDPEGSPDELHGEILDLLYDGLVHRAKQGRRSR
jgi:AcrR family transcriptional regulator